MLFNIEILLMIVCPVFFYISLGVYVIVGVDISAARMRKNKLERLAVFLLSRSLAEALHAKRSVIRDNQRAYCKHFLDSCILVKRNLTVGGVDLYGISGV